MVLLLALPQPLQGKVNEAYPVVHHLNVQVAVFPTDQEVHQCQDEKGYDGVVSQPLVAHLALRELPMLLDYLGLPEILRFDHKEL